MTPELGFGRERNLAASLRFVGRMNVLLGTTDWGVFLFEFEVEPLVSSEGSSVAGFDRVLGILMNYLTVSI